MQELLKNYIAEVISEMKKSARVPNQLLDKRGSKKETEEEDMDEMSTAGSIAGFTAPLGASNLDMGLEPVKPGGKLKKRKKTFARWK